MLKSVLLGAVLAFALTANAAVAQSLIVNGGFETGNFSGWTTGGNSDLAVDDRIPHTGTYYANFAASNTNSTLSQTFAANAGNSLTLSYFLRVDGNNQQNNFFSVVLNNVPLFAQANLAIQDYIQYTFTATALASNTLTFAGRNNPSFTRLDDVSVTQQAVAVPGPVAGAGLIPVAGLAAAWFTRRRRTLAA